MVHFNLGVVFALVAGTAAGVIALLSWRLFRRSPVGRAVFVLAVMMSAFVIYHTIVFVLGGNVLFATIAKSSVYTLLVVFIGMMVDAQSKIRNSIQNDKSE